MFPVGNIFENGLWGIGVREITRLIHETISDQDQEQPCKTKRRPSLSFVSLGPGHYLKIYVVFGEYLVLSPLILCFLIPPNWPDNLGEDLFFENMFDR